MHCVDATDIVERLLKYYTLDQVDEWLDAPHPQLGGESATALIMKGQKDQVHAVIDRLDADAYI
ncbi:MAG: hypothetical protein AAFQ90_12720 [Pseudomonadota bacterium]